MVRDFFVSFSDNHRRFMYLYLLNNKADVLNDFNTYKEEEEKQYEDHKIRYRQTGKEYHGRYTQKEND
jgi:hypothetical protein